MGVHATIQAAPCWTEVRLCEDLLLAMLGQTLVAVDRHTGEIRWSRPSTRQTTTYAIGGRVLFGLDCDLPSGGRRGIQPEGLLFALDTATGARTTIRSGGPEASFTYTHAGATELEWLWSISNRLSVASAAHGTFSVNGGAPSASVSHWVASTPLR